KRGADARSGAAAEDARAAARRFSAAGRRGAAGNADGPAGAPSRIQSHAAGPGALDRGSLEPAHESSDYELDVAALLRSGNRGHVGGFRDAGRKAFASGAARLAGYRIRAPEVESEGDA